MAGFALALGALLIALAWPRMMAGFARLPGDHPLESIQRGLQVEPADLDRLVASRERARAWTDDPEMIEQLGLARLAQQRLLEPTDGDLASAREALASALGRRPLDSHTLLRLAYIDLAEGRRAAIDSWRLAIETAPYRADQFEARIGLGVRLWPLLRAEDQNLVRQQVRLLWGENHYRAITLAKRLGKRDMFRDALRLMPDAADEFERRY